MKVPAELVLSGGLFSFQLEEWIEVPRQVTVEDRPGSRVISHRGRQEIIADYQPRVIWGEKDGIPFTVLDAHMRMEAGSSLLPAQVYEARSILLGAHVKNAETLAQGIRATFEVNHVGWMGQEPIDISQGRIGPWATSNGAGLTWEPKDDRARHITIHTLRERFIPKVQVLLQLWTGRVIGVQDVEIRIKDVGWCSLETVCDDRAIPLQQTLLNPSTLSIDTVAKWLRMAPQLGPLPFIAVAELSNLQVKAQVMTAALEGLHARLYPSSNRFTASSRRRKRATKAAAEAGAEILASSGEDKETIKQAIREALAHAHRPSYAARLRELLLRVEAAAPGLMGPSTEDWIKDILAVRNTLSHGAKDDDEFGEPEISRYYVLSQSAQWAIRIRLLLELVDETTMRSGLVNYDNFMFVLANMDREQYWPDFSAHDHFSKLARKTTL
ncbi:HEPN domain-containing protein [Flaviflexus equikiangi]|uniref:Apea-like HEPN domain-containing protein n=1 Tax=Flaviflexus equikiangi TaxID=2758573 RepID=A0ABS2TCB2_9ACTO|nr:HEPN domain-containing protein [Flaviflexus equikiangi]MBM9432285.1 hypothetical protein [Flaviflexus equikiangi]